MREIGDLRGESEGWLGGKKTEKKGTKGIYIHINLSIYCLFEKIDQQSKNNIKIEVGI